MKFGGRVRLWILLILDVLMIAMETYALTVSWAESGAKLFRYYTQNSNILALNVCVICGVREVLCIVRGRRMPGWTRRMRYLSGCCLLLTLIVAGVFLVPTDEDLSFAGFMLEGKYLFLHTVCPLVGVAQFFLHEGPRFREKHALLALVPTVIYGTISLCLNAAGAYTGPYPFLRVRQQEGYVTAVGCIAVLGVAYAAARILAALGCIGARKKPLRKTVQ